MWNVLSRFFNKKKKEFHEYGFNEISLNFEEIGEVKYAQWLHPGEMQYNVTQTHLDFFKKFINKGDLVIDIGANQGDSTLPMALAAGQEGLTLALEPNPHSFKVLAKNSTLNKSHTNIVPLNFAATHEDGEFVFGSGDPSFGNGGIVGFTFNKKRNTRYTFNVTGRNLQNFLSTNYNEQLAKLSFIKIDTEGYDKEIIKSLSALIKSYRPYLIAECFGPSLKEEKIELHKVISSFNYSLYKINDFSFDEIKPCSLDEIAKKTFNILAIPNDKINPVELR